MLINQNNILIYIKYVLGASNYIISLFYYLEAFQTYFYINIIIIAN